MSFEEWISEVVKSKGINVSEMARKTDIPYQALYDSLFNCKKQRELRSSELIKICNFVGINPMNFIEKEREVLNETLYD